MLVFHMRFPRMSPNHESYFCLFRLTEGQVLTTWAPQGYSTVIRRAASYDEPKLVRSLR